MNKIVKPTKRTSQEGREKSKYMYQNTKRDFPIVCQARVPESTIFCYRKYNLKQLPK